MERQMQRRTQRYVEEVTEQPPRRQSDVDLAETDELLEAIDELLAEVDADKEAAERATFRDKIGTVNLIGRRAVDPCADAIAVPESWMEPLLRMGYKEVPCNGC